MTAFYELVVFFCPCYVQYFRMSFVCMFVHVYVSYIDGCKYMSHVLVFFNCTFILCDRRVRSIFYLLVKGIREFGSGLEGMLYG